MKLDGFIGPAYTLDSVNVDAQRCVNLYLEAIESGKGKGAQVAYLRSTPGLDGVLDVGSGPIRLLHVDSIGRVFAVSGAQIYSISKKAQWRYKFTSTSPAAKSFEYTAVNATSNEITISSHGFLTGLRVTFSGTSTYPNPLDVGDYYIIRVDANTIKLATTFANALSGTAIDITTQGLGTDTLTPVSYGSLYGLKHSDIDFSSNSFLRVAHGYVNGIALQFKATGSYATGISPSTTYYVTNRTNDTFQLASSLANALAGTAVDLTDVADAWTSKLMGAEGEYGGTAVTLASSSGPVKAASMSLGGNGTDSSTMFVDGSNNYLLEDTEGNQSLGVLGAVDFSQAVLNIDADITMTSLVDVDEHVSSEGITVSDGASSDPAKVGSNRLGPDSEPVIAIAFYKDVVNATGATSYHMEVTRGAIDFAQAVLNITDDITIKRYELSNEDDLVEVDTHVDSDGITVSDTEGGPLPGFLFIDFYKDVFDANETAAYYLTIQRATGEALTTAQLVTVLTTGALTGKTIFFQSLSSPAPGYTRTQMDRTNYVFTGGGASQSTSAAFGTPVHVDFTRETSTAEPLTTAELVTALSTGALSGKNVGFGLYGSPYGPAVGTTRTQLPRTNYTFTGGDTQTTASAFGTPVAADFTRETSVGEGYGSVPSATQIVWSDGFFIVNKAGTNKFFISGLQDFEIDTLDFTSSEGSPDIVLALAVINRTLYVLNELTTEVYANTGNADFPFERMQGGFIEVGTLAAYSVAQAADTLFWLGRSKEGQGIVYAMSGSTPRRISTHAIEQAISGYASPQDATGYTYAKNGHVFYALNFAEATWVYDLATGMWHERAYTNSGTLERHRVECVAHIPQTGVLLGGDYETGELYVIDDATYSDDGDAITRLRACPHLSTGDLNRVFYSRFLLDMETGIGLDGGVQGSNPTVMLDWSDDGGHTWSSEQFALADAGSGSIGDYKKRVVWRRLGKSRDRVWRVKITDPVKVVLIDAHVDVQAGAS